MTELRIIRSKRKLSALDTADWQAVCRRYEEGRVIDYVFGLRIGHQKALGLQSLSTPELWREVETLLPDSPTRQHFKALQPAEPVQARLARTQAVIEAYIASQAPLAYEFLPCGMGLRVLSLNAGERNWVHTCFREASSPEQALPVLACQQQITLSPQARIDYLCQKMRSGQSVSE